LPRDRFVEELKRSGLVLEGNLLDFFLKRLNIDLTLTSGSIPYRDVINTFKQKTDPTKKRINADNPLFVSSFSFYIFINYFICRPPGENRQTSLERQVEYLISTNYERIHDELTRLDNYHYGTVNGNDMRSLIEDLLQFPLRPDEYYQLFKQFPIDENGKIKYKDYLKQVMDRTTAQQQQQEQQQTSPVYVFHFFSFVLNLKIKLKNSTMGIYEIKEYS
jgi:hypothetical protein